MKGPHTCNLLPGNQPAERYSIGWIAWLIGGLGFVSLTRAGTFRRFNILCCRIRSKSFGKKRDPGVFWLSRGSNVFSFDSLLKTMMLNTRTLSLSTSIPVHYASHPCARPFGCWVNAGNLDLHCCELVISRQIKPKETTTTHCVTSQFFYSALYVWCGSRGMWALKHVSHYKAGIFGKRCFIFGHFSRATSGGVSRGHCYRE